MTRVWLIRHGEPVASACGRCYGSLDVGLSDSGRAQVAAVWEFLRDEGIGVVY
jgi:alpha-ribazole phosphatase